MGTIYIMQLVHTLVVLAILLSTASAGTFCDVLGTNKPSFCTCTDTTLGFNLVCTQKFADDLLKQAPSVESTFKLTSCGTPELGVSAKVTMHDGNEHTLAEKKYKFPKTVTIPVPGAQIPPFGVNLYLTLGGDPSALELDLKLDACATVAFVEYCGADLPNSVFSAPLCPSSVCKGSTNPFRIPILKKTLSFTDACKTSSSTGSSSSATTTGTTATATATTSYAIKSTVKLSGISASQFATEHANFKKVIASYLSICGSAGTSKCTHSDVTIHSASRRGLFDDVSVEFSVKTTSQTKAATGANTLNTAITTNSASFVAALILKGGNLLFVTGSTTTSVPTVTTASTSSAGRIEAGSMVVSLVMALAALFV